MSRIIVDPAILCGQPMIQGTRPDGGSDVAMDAAIEVLLVALAVSFPTAVVVSMGSMVAMAFCRRPDSTASIGSNPFNVIFHPSELTDTGLAARRVCIASFVVALGCVCAVIALGEAGALRPIGHPRTQRQAGE